MLEHLEIKNPKRRKNELGFQSWFPYYAGFSPTFVESIINTACLDSNACIADTWNGSGTTTTIAGKLGYRGWGLDLNPVMLIAAKAALLQSRDSTCILPLVKDILSCPRKRKVRLAEKDPLTSWFIGEGVNLMRDVQRNIAKLLVENYEEKMIDALQLESISSLAAFFYVALFRTVRKLVKPLTTSNPTWVKTPKGEHEKIALEIAVVKNTFREQVNEMLASIEYPAFKCDNPPQVTLKLGSSCKIPAQISADLIISSPPYCTRIDYAVATSPELALLGYSRNKAFNDLRKSLIGNSTVPVHAQSIKEQWGTTCNRLLQDLFNHPSKASSTYYFKNHLQYFDSIYNSLKEIRTILHPKGICILVVQDSYYKDIHNDLPKIFVEMARNNGLFLRRRQDFISNKNMAGLQSQNRKYRKEYSAIESVLCFTTNSYV